MLQVFTLNIYALLNPWAILSYVTPSIKVKLYVSVETLSGMF